MWRDLCEPWQKAFELAWQAFKNDSIPIGAVIYSESGYVSSGKNRIFETSDHPLAGLYMGHAEMDAMMNLKSYSDEEIRDFTIYTTMEPCPMCFSTMYMMHLKGLKYASRDRFAGSTNLYKSTWYFEQKPMVIEHIGGELEAFQLVLQTSHECKRKGKDTTVIKKWRLDNSLAVDLGIDMFEEGYFDKSKNINDIYDGVINRYRSLHE